MTCWAGRSECGSFFWGANDCTVGDFLFGRAGLGSWYGDRCAITLLCPIKHLLLTGFWYSLFIWPEDRRLSWAYRDLTRHSHCVLIGFQQDRLTTCLALEESSHCFVCCYLQQWLKLGAHLRSGLMWSETSSSTVQAVELDAFHNFHNYKLM